MISNGNCLSFEPKSFKKMFCTFLDELINDQIKLNYKSNNENFEILKFSENNISFYFQFELVGLTQLFKPEKDRDLISSLLAICIYCYCCTLCRIEIQITCSV
jgi:hypothetical protein